MTARARGGATLPSMGIAINDEVRRLLGGRHFAVLATINPDGGPQTSAMWVGRDGDDVLFCTVAEFRKRRNIERDPPDPLVWSEHAFAWLARDTNTAVDSELPQRSLNRAVVPFVVPC